MIKIKYVGKGMLSKDIKFSPTHNDGLYDIEDEDEEYFFDTFPNSFVLIEKTKETKKETTTTTPPKAKRTRKPRIKSTDVSE